MSVNHICHFCGNNNINSKLLLVQRVLCTIPGMSHGYYFSHSKYLIFFVFVLDKAERNSVSLSGISYNNHALSLNQALPKSAKLAL